MAIIANDYKVWNLIQQIIVHQVLIIAILLLSALRGKFGDLHQSYQVASVS